MIRRGVTWAAFFLLWTTAIVGAGAALGAAAFTVAGLCFRTGYTTGELVRSGARIGGFYCLLWAPGIAVVLGVMRAYRRRHPDAS